MEALFLLHSGLPTEAPGSDASTLEAIRRLGDLARPRNILDVWCGPGKQSLVLACHFKTPVVAVDIHQSYLDQLTAAAEEAGLTGYVKTRKISMEALDYPPESFDLIWTEGAVYCVYPRPCAAGGLCSAVAVPLLLQNSPG